MSMVQILEELQQVHIEEEFFNSLSISSNMDINESFDVIKESRGEINEGSVVTYKGQPFDNFGHFMCIVGAPGSGKGYIRKNKVLGMFKVFDVDRLKELYIMAQSKGKKSFVGDKKKYDLMNPEDTSALHQRVKDMGLKDKQEKAFFNSLGQDKLPNICYDITGDDQNKLKALGKKMKDLGYKNTVVWVITNREMAMVQNITRDRVVSQQIFHKIHNDVIKNVFPFLKKGAEDYDEAWLVFNSLGSAKTLSDAERTQLNNIGTIKLEKSGSGFVIPKEIEMMIYNILGPMEKDPNHPQVYKDMDELRGNREELARIKAGMESILKKTDNV